jgi:hypothetical protein
MNYINQWNIITATFKNTFQIKDNRLLQVDAFILPFAFCVIFAIRKLGENQVGLKTHQLLAYDGDNIETINTETLTDASKEVGLEVNVEKTKYMLVSCHQNAVQNQNIQTANRTFEHVSQFKYLGTTVTNQNLIQEEILSSRLLSKM